MPDKRLNKLTDRKIRSLINAGDAVKISDGGGLTFNISQAGYSFWQLRYSFGGQRREVHIGSLDDFPLAKARAERDRLRAILKDPENPQDPARVKKAQKATESISAANPDTFQALTEDWLENIIRKQVEKPEIVERTLRKWVYPVIGELAVNDIEPMQVIACLRKIVAAGAPTVANDARRHIQKIFDYGVIIQTVSINPAAQITQKIAGSEETSRNRFLDLGEIKKLFRVMASERDWFGRDNELVVRLLIMLGVRKGELVGARWSEVDDDAAVWTIPKSRIKTRKKGNAADFKVPLSPQAVEIFDELYSRAGESEYVLPARRINRRSRSRNLGHISPDTVNSALSRLDAGIDHFTLHDLRRTNRSQLSALGIPFAVAERCLNHKLPGQGEIYDRHDMLEQRRDALERWAECLDILEADGVQAARDFIGGAQVIPMRRSA
jgi:integrase